MTDLSVENVKTVETIDAADIGSRPARGGFSLGSIVLLLAIVLAAGVVGLALIRQNQTQPTSGPAPDFTLTTFDGSTVRLSDLRGQIVVVNFWASWCIPCHDEAPELQDVWEAYRDRGVIMVGIAYTDTQRNALAFMNEYGMTYPNGLDLETRISERYHITGVPETFVVDRDGNVSEFFMVPVTVETLSTALDRLLLES